MSRGLETLPTGEPRSAVRTRRILALATQGAGGNDEDRLQALISGFPAELFPFDRRAKTRNLFQLLRMIRRTKPHLVFMEGTGWAGGFAVLLGRLLAGVPYVVSSGDAVGPFLTARYPWASPLFGIYERALCRWAAGYIGWTPYLAGRALTFGARRAMTAAGWAPSQKSPCDSAEIRSRLGIPAGTLVVGIMGSLIWNRRVRYCYGREIVASVSRLDRPDVVALIVGDGDGRKHLEALAGERLGGSIILTGQVPRNEVPDYLAAMDMASLPQSLDGVGSFRYTTKLSEYLAAGLPVITGQIPLAYDLDGGWLWRLPGAAPWDARYLDAMTQLLTQITADELAAKRSAVPQSLPDFDRTLQIARVTSFLNDLLDEREASKS
jgi:hypothetical protein